MTLGEQGDGGSTQREAFRRRVLALGTVLFPMQIVLFLVLFAWHVQGAVQPRCIYFVQNDLFLWNYRFFRDFLMVPGGMAAWTGEIVLQVCHWGWPGTLVLTAIAWLIAMATMRFMKCLEPIRERGQAPDLFCNAATPNTTSGSQSPFWDRLLAPASAAVAWTMPMIVLLLAHSRYDHVFSVSIGLALAMSAALWYARSSMRWGKWRVAWFAAACAFLYYLTGAAFYVFALCAVIYEFYSPGKRWSILGLVVVAGAARLAVGGILALFHPAIFYLHIPNALPFAAERSLNAIAWLLLVSFPLWAFLVAEWTARRREPLAEPSPEMPDGVPPSSARYSPRLRWATETVLFLGVATLVGQLAVSRGLRTVLTLHDCADSERWDEVLSLAPRVPPKLYSGYVVHDVNMALYFTGRLPFDMFSYPQAGTPFVVPSTSKIDPYSLSLRKLGDFYLRLGRVNQAECYAHEDFTLRPSAQSLRLLARIAMVKGQPELARLFLTVLRDDLVHGSWADEWLDRLAQDPSLSADAEVAALRAVKLAQEDVHHTARLIPAKTIAQTTVSIQKQVASLLEQNPRNRMAFEFLMAVHLVDKNVGAVVELLPKAAEFGYSGTPPLYEEAAMMYVAATKDKRRDLDDKVVINGCPISQQTVSRARKVDAALSTGRAKGDEIARLVENLKLPYYRYCLYIHHREK